MLPLGGSIQGARPPLSQALGRLCNLKLSLTSDIKHGTILRGDAEYRRPDRRIRGERLSLSFPIG